jgi:hypothetical protein
VVVPDSANLPGSATEFSIPRASFYPFELKTWLNPSVLLTIPVEVPPEPEPEPTPVPVRIDGGGGAGYSGVWYDEARKKRKYASLAKKEERERRELEELERLLVRLREMPQPTETVPTYGKIDLLAAETAESVRLAEQASLERQRIAQANHERALRLLAEAEALIQDEEDAIILLMMD